MLQHIALTVNDPEEIENFYKEILLFTTKHKFSVNGEITRQIFNVGETTDVYMMSYDNTYFEIFISPEKERKVFMHTCLAYRKAETICHNAIKRGYHTLVKKNKDHSTYFIRDKSGNIFEIKEMNECNKNEK
jgi:catechol 2,3-dioxygenase-like lactoylglutathione lyase family enzyme